jgi:hypothetical protein
LDRFLRLVMKTATVASWSVIGMLGDLGVV